MEVECDNFYNINLETKDSTIMIQIIKHNLNGVKELNDEDDCEEEQN